MPIDSSDRKRLVVRADSLLLSLATVFFWAPLAAQINPVGVGPIVITVSDLDRAVSFYTGVLSFRQVGSSREQLDSLDRLTGIFGTNASVATLQLGSESIALVQYHTPRGRPCPPIREVMTDGFSTSRSWFPIWKPPAPALRHARFSRSRPRRKLCLNGTRAPAE